MIKKGIRLIVLLGLLRLLKSQQYHDDYKYSNDRNYKGVRERLEVMVQEHYRDCVVRVQDLNPMRFMYEESPHYEIGYIMGEIVERYKKIVYNLRRPTLYKSDTVFETLRNLEWIQKYYFEIYHLINMMHEIAAKWQGKEEFKDLSNPPNYREIRKIKEMQKQAQKQLEKEKRRKQRKLKKMQKVYQSMGNQDNQESSQFLVKQYNKWWPIDYGWEIDYYW